MWLKWMKYVLEQSEWLLQSVAREFVLERSLGTHVECCLFWRVIPTAKLYSRPTLPVQSRDNGSLANCYIVFK